MGFDETLDHPEIIVFDLPPREAFKILAGLFRNIRGGFRFEDGDAWATSRGDAVFRQVHPTRIYDELWLFFASYRRLVKTECDFGLEALQLVLPDTEARLPSEAGYDEALRSCQPELYTASNAEVAASARL